MVRGKRHKTVEGRCVCLFTRPTAAATAGGFVAEVGRGRYLAVDI